MRLCLLWNPVRYRVGKGKRIMMTMEEAQRRALAGGLWLDMISPGWRDTVDWSVFDIDNPRRCVLGQVFTGHHSQFVPGYLISGWQYALETFWRGDWRPSEALGFTPTRVEWGQSTAGMLQAAWLALWGPDA